VEIKAVGAAVAGSGEIEEEVAAEVGTAASMEREQKERTRPA